MSEQPLVSVVVPTRNNARTIRPCLQSVRDQTYPHVELIVVDNDSTDETFDVATELADVALTGGPERSAQRNLGIEVSEKLRDYLLLGAVRGSVNLPEVGVGAMRGGARIVHLHRDQPGVMSHLNGVFADAGLNVTQLHLETDGGLGVAVVDLNRVPETGTLGAVRAIPGTLASFVAMASRA